MSARTSKSSIRSGRSGKSGKSAKSGKSCKSGKTIKTNASVGSCPDRKLFVKKVLPKEESDSSEVISSTDEEDRWKETIKINDVPADYWSIQKLVKFIKAGNQTATIVALCCLQDFDLTTQVNQSAIQDSGGLEVLVNLLECNDTKSQLGALSVLAYITANIDIRRTLVDLGGVPLLVNILSSPSTELKTMAAETIAKVAKVRLARKLVRKCGGIPKLIDLLDADFICKPGELLDYQRSQLEMTKAGARALWSLSEAKQNQKQMRKCGIVPLIACLLKSNYTDLLIPIMGTIQRCAHWGTYQLAVTSEGMVPMIVKHLNSPNLDLKLQCAAVMFKVGVDSKVREMIRQAGGLEPLVAIAKDRSLRENKPLLSAATGAIWMCATTEANVKKFDQLRTVPVLVLLLTDENDEVLTNCVGAIAECVKFQNNREALRNAGGLPLLVNLLNSTHPLLLENICKALKECAADPDSMEILEHLDAVRMVWSLLKHSNPRVQAYAAWAICPCIENAKNSGELVRSFVGAMELVVGLLKSKDILVLSSVCAAIATIAKDKENVAVLTDHKVIYMLAELVHTTDDLLRENLAAAIASCAPFGNNIQELGRLRTVTPIVGYMVSNNPNVHRSVAMALQELSKDPQNCITMHQSGVVPFLLETVGSSDKILQAASAGCLQNIRELALRAEEYLLKQDM